MLKETIVKNARYESALRMKIKDKHTARLTSTGFDRETVLSLDSRRIDTHREAKRRPCLVTSLSLEVVVCCLILFCLLS